LNSSDGKIIGVSPTLRTLRMASNFDTFRVTETAKHNPCWGEGRRAGDVQVTIQG